MYGIELAETRRLKKNFDGLLNYCNLKFQPLEGVYVYEHWSRLVIFLNIFISGDKMMEYYKCQFYYNIFGVQKFTFHIITVQNISFME